MLTSTEVAQKINANQRATDRLMNALCTIGLLKKVHGKFYNSEEASQYLVKGKPEFMSGLMHSVHLWDSWAGLTNAVRSGKKSKGEKVESPGENRLESFISAMHYRGLKEAKILSMMLDFSNVKKMLDVGCGSGAFSMEFIKKNSFMNAVLFDLPDVIPIAQRYVNAENMKENISFKSGNYLNDEFGSGYDLIFLSAIIHINSYEENKKLIKKCFDALNRNGQLIIRDWIMNEERTTPVGGTFFALNMLVATDSGDTYTENEIKDWLISAGISKIERKNTSFDSSLIIGVKD
jgi:2-polyprenyl-3-methyl-5-hydroxy-6-metoxy-1,4-benzoquinol methylase